MESIVKADIFFFITSIFIIIVSLITIVAGVYFLMILRNFHKISKILRTYTEDVDDNLRDLGEHIRQSKLFTFIFGKEKPRKESERKVNNKRTI